jgi:hypothetical protein
MGFGTYRNVEGEYTPTNQILATTNWNDLANKIADKAIEKDYIAERLGATTITSLTDNDRNYAISKLESEIKQINGLTRKSRVRYVINKIKDYVGRSGGVVTTNEIKPVLFDWKTIFQANTNTDYKPISSSNKVGDKVGDKSGDKGGDKSGDDNGKGKKTWIYVGVGVGALALVGTIVYLATRKKK